MQAVRGRITGNEIVSPVFGQSQSSSDTTFSLEAHCKGEVRSHAATTLFCLLLLKKQEAIHLHQSSPYEDIVATPGPNLYN